MVNIKLGGFHHKKQMEYTTWLNFWISFVGLVILSWYSILFLDKIGKPESSHD